jgi:c-di-GMP-binding flagellar brake protein YcgR
MEERRRFVRINKNVRISYRVQKGFLRTETKSKNVSQGGISFAIPQRLADGVVIEMQIHILDSDSSIDALGKVLWSYPVTNEQHPFMVGVEFIEISPAAQRILLKVLNQAG